MQHSLLLVNIGLISVLSTGAIICISKFSLTDSFAISDSYEYDNDWVLGIESTFVIDSDDLPLSIKGKIDAVFKNISIQKTKTNGFFYKNIKGNQGYNSSYQNYLVT